MTVRTVKQVIRPVSVPDEQGIARKRVIGRADAGDFAPFFRLDVLYDLNPADDSGGFTLPPAPGVETVTYLISGLPKRRDGVHAAGAVSERHTNAGSGKLPRKTPVNSAPVLGLKLDILLPGQDNRAVPVYGPLHSAKIPKVVQENATVGIVSGSYEGVSSSFKGHYVKTRVLDVSLNANSGWTLSVPKKDTVFIYVVDGEAAFEEDGRLTEAKNAVLLSNGDTVRVQTGKDRGARFVLFSAAPHQAV